MPSQATPMLIGEGTAMTTSTYSRLEALPWAGKVRSSPVLRYLQPRPSIWLSQVLLKKQSGWGNSVLIWRVNPLILLWYTRTTNLLSVWLGFHGRTKHINIKFHFVQGQVNADTIRIQYCPTEDMLADFLTKGVSTEKFMKLRKLCGMCQIVLS